MQAQPVRAYQIPPRQRGAYTSKFRAVEITSNFFEASLKGISKVVIFDFRIIPTVEAKNDKELQSIWEGVRSQVAAKIKKPVWRKFCVFSSEECPGSFEVATGPYTVTIRQRKVYDLNNKAVFLQFLNNSLRGIMSRGNYVEIGRSGKYFTTEKTQNIDNLKMFKGFSSTFQECEKGMFLRVDTARKIVRKDTVLDAINTVYKVHAGKDKEEKRNELKKVLIDAIVMTNYGKSTFYRVLDVEFKSMLEVSISDEIPNLKEYYRLRYNIQVQHEAQPLLLVENKIQRRERAGSRSGPSYLLPELCSLTGIPDNFDEQRRKKISEQTILNPKDKHDEILSFMRELGERKELGRLEQLGIGLSKQMSRVQACQISNPKLELGGGQSVEKNKESFFQLFGQPLFSSKHGLNLTILHTKQADVGGMIGTFESTAKKLKLDLVVKKQETPMFKDRDIIGGIEKALKNDDKINILMIVLPGNLKSTYPRVKQELLSLKAGKEMISQFVVENTLRKKGAQSIHTKLLLQMAAKRGNILWVPAFKGELGDVLDKTCIMGIDSSSKGGQTCLSACATTNSTFSLLASATVNAPAGGDKYKFMLTVASKCVEAYATRNKCPPKELIVFMLAVPGDQVNLVQENFCRRLEDTVREAHPGSKMRMTCVMVNLRNSERFFSAGQEARNVPPGTLVNSHVVSKNYDFFIVSQQSNKGSIVPNHYKVIDTNSKLEEGHLQELIYSQCFNYANWSGSIKIPAILQYAKKCAKFSAEVMEGKEVCPSLLTRPYFI